MSMSLAALAAMARDQQPFKPIIIEGGRTRGQMIPENQPPKRKNEAVVRPLKGVDYAKKLEHLRKNANEEEELRHRFYNVMEVSAEAASSLRRMTALEDATSLDTHDREIATISDDLNAVYKMYYFPNKEDDPSNKLLIHEFKNDILRQIDVHNVVIIKGPTGCGKTTQVPLFILNEARERNIYCSIIVTQPRRIAATSIAQRVSKERGWNMGTVVGYQIALEKKISRDTRLTFVTAGVLLQKLVSGQFEEYTHIIVDEVHERECETDFMLIILRELIRMKSNRKKLILMSATMASSQFTNYFTRKSDDGRLIVPPVVDLPHDRIFEVTVFYLDDIQAKLSGLIRGGEEMDMDRPFIPVYMYDVAVALMKVFTSLDELDKDYGTGAVLVFLPGIVEIDNMSKFLQADRNPKEKWLVCPLHSTMSFEEQMKVFSRPPSGSRKIILATNIAESSITVPDVKYVIDFCLTKRQQTNKDTFYSSLQLCWESKSQAEQRAGRAGRTMPGCVYRMVYKSLYSEFDDDSPPEIVRCPLDRLVLKSKELDMGSPAEILGLAMDPPDLTNIERTILNLKELGALSLCTRGVYDEQDGDLTFTGQVMADLPLDTQLSKLILLGNIFSVLRECVKMACCMSGKNIFTAPRDKKMESYNTKISWACESRSDPITALNLFENWKQMKSQGRFDRSGGESEQQWANRNFAHLKALKEVEKLELEIFERLRRQGIMDNRVERLKENDEKVVPFILKVCLAGACYPNFFLHEQSYEEDAVRALGNRDPCRTVYFRGFPQDQPGPLYRDSVKNLLANCGSGIKVQFDGSSKVFVEFESSVVPEDGLEANIENDIPIPGRVMKAVYRAVKMRHLDVPMNIDLLKLSVARQRAQSIFSDHLYPNPGCYGAGLDGNPKKKYFPVGRLPSLNQTFLRIQITHINDPSNFYAVLSNQSSEGYLIQKEINDIAEGTLVDLHPDEVIIGAQCLAKYRDHATGSVQWYRAKIVAHTRREVQVMYIDYGNYGRVSVNEVKGYGPRLMDLNVMCCPPMCVRCRLAEIQPKCLEGSGPVEWSKEAIDCFRKTCKSYECDAKIYSVVNDTMAILMYPSRHRPEKFKLPLDESINYLLVKNDHATFVEEPFLSKENHERREMIAMRKEDFLNHPTLEDHYAWMERVELPSVSREDILKRIKLIGPFSPLEMKAHAITRKCVGKSVSIDWNSINSVLINETPTETTTRLIVAGTVSQNSTSSALTLRNTTLMPSVRGLSGILAMLFAPVVELRVDEKMSCYTGAMCGLGCDENGVSYDQENDVEVTFDCKIMLDDIQEINKIRFWMERILCRSAKQFHTDHASSESGLLDVQSKCLANLLSIFSRERDPLCPIFFGPKYEWNQVPDEHILFPRHADSSKRAVYRLIWGVRLNDPSREEEKRKMVSHLARLNSYIESGVLAQPVTCELCQYYTENVRSLDFHVKTINHRRRSDEFFGESFGKADLMGEEVDQYHRCLRTYRQQMHY